MSGGAASSAGGGPESPSTTTCEQLGLGLPAESMASSEGSRARESATLASAKGWAIPKPFCGERCGESFASLSPDGLWLRTSRQSSLFTAEQFGPRLLGTWPRSGSISGGTCFPLRPSAPRTCVSGLSPLLGTPTARDWKGPGFEGQLPTDLALLPSPRARVDKEHGPDGKHWSELRPTVLALLPTPRTSDQNGPGEHGSGGPDLRTAMQLLPTPVSGDASNSRSATAPARGPESNYRPGTNLSDVMYKWSGGRTVQPSSVGKPSTVPRPRLSPSFVEWMMGAPQGWSDPDCPLSAMEFRCSLG